MSLPQNGPITLPDCGSCGAVDERSIDTNLFGSSDPFVHEQMNIMIEHWFVLEEATRVWQPAPEPVCAPSLSCLPADGA
jgi:hypothetical protein